MYGQLIVQYNVIITIITYKHQQLEIPLPTRTQWYENVVTKISEKHVLCDMRHVMAVYSHMH